MTVGRTGAGARGGSDALELVRQAYQSAEQANLGLPAPRSATQSEKEPSAVVLTRWSRALRVLGQEPAAACQNASAALPTRACSR
jgi:hypothetical protein